MRLLHLAAIALLATALYWSVRLAFADAPPNPWDAQAWIERGLLENSEAPLLEAVRLDHTFTPIWTLANYYVRNNRIDKFWTCARACLLIEEHDPEPVFDLCRRVTDRDETIQNAIPAQPRILSRYLQYLIRRSAGVAATSAAYDAMMQTPGSKDSSVLLDYCEYLVERKRPEAIAPWNAATGLQLDPLHGFSLTNGDFTRDLASRGFDWHTPLQPGISGAFFRSIPAFRLRLDGEENETAELLWQIIPVIARRKYRLRFRYRSEDIAPESGLRWQVSDFAASADLSSDSWTDHTFDFENPRDVQLARLSLRYRRPAGSLRLKGTIGIQRVTLAFRQ